MTNIVNLCFSQLSEAAYANLIPGSSLIAELQNPDFNMAFSRTQAADFVSHWAVVDHLPNTDDGFSGTLFRRLDDDPLTGLKAGDLVFALRGTEGLNHDDLYQADFDEIVNNGLAFHQIIDMYNYWQRLITPAGELARQAVLVPATPNVTPAGARIDDGTMQWTIQFEYSGIGLGKLDLDDHVVAATGHSLGGPLGDRLHAPVSRMDH